MRRSNCQSGDGLLRIRLMPLGADSHAEVLTPAGVFAGRDHLITITRIGDAAMMADSRSIGQQQAQHQHEERSQALRALLMTPLMTPAHAEFAAVRRHADDLRAWFARETGWALHIERDCARLYKRPANLLDASRGLPGYDRRRYVLLCLACAVLERADPQITLRVLGDRLLVLAAEPGLVSRGFSFALQAQHERRELVAVCRSLLEFGVLLRVAGDEEGFVRSGADHERRRRALRRAAPRAGRNAGRRARPLDLEPRRSAGDA